MNPDSDGVLIEISDALIDYIVATVITQLLSSGLIYPQPAARPSLEAPV